MSIDCKDCSCKTNNYCRDREEEFWKPLCKLGKLCAIRIDVSKDTIDDDYEENMETDNEDEHRGNSSVSGSGDRNWQSFETPSDRLGFVDGRNKGRWKHQRCYPRRRPARRNKLSLAPGTSTSPLFKDGYSNRQEGSALRESPEIRHGYVVEGNSTDESLDGEWEEGELEEELEEKETVGGQHDGDNVCKCGPRTFSLENLKLKWEKFRHLVGRCYPALPCSDGGYYILPECPPVAYEGQSEVDHDPSQISPSEDDISGDDRKADEIESPAQEEPGNDRSEALTSLDSQTKGVSDQKFESFGPSKRIVCYTPEFWGKLFQIVILAPLLAFTAFLFVEWFISRRRYIKKSLQLKKVKRQNEVLVSECDRLEAYMMSTQMSPLANGKRQAKVKEEAARICQSLSECKQKMRELEEEKSVLLEVLHNLRKPEDDKSDSSKSRMLPIFAKPDSHDLRTHNPTCSCTYCIPPTTYLVEH